MSSEDSAAARAEAAKAKGNEAFKAQDYDGAVAFFSTAIEADPTNHVLYSNRSGAHAAKGSFKDALLDANKCIDLKADWAKGHSRRGAAYYGLRNWPQAQAAYEKGLELDPNSAAIKGGLESVKLARNPAARAAAAAASGSATVSTGSTAAMLSLMSLVFGMLYMLPIFPTRAVQMYRLSVGNIVMLFVNSLWNMPKKVTGFKALTDPTLRATQEWQAATLCIFMLVSPPMPFALTPFLAIALLNVSHAYKGAAAKLPVVSGFLLAKMNHFTSDEGSMQVQAFGAVSEVIVTVMSPLLIVLQGTRAAILGFFFFQYTCRRYKSNHLTVQAVTLLTQKADGFFAHRFVPSPLGMIFGRVKAAIRLAASYIQ